MRGPSKFKTQRHEPIGPYIVDFVGREQRLVIEVDGGQHAADKRDAVRDRWLGENRYRVLRFWNNDLTGNMDGVLEAIYAAIYGSSSAEPVHLKHQRRKCDAVATPPRRALRADPPPAGEGEGTP